MAKSKEPVLPTYKSIVAVLEGKTGSGWKLGGWTVARAALITVPMRVVGVPWKQAFMGGMLASVMISTLALTRSYNAAWVARKGKLDGARPRRARQIAPPRGLKRIA